MILIASKGHFFTQIPQPMQSSSDMNANFEFGVTSMHSFPNRTTGHDLLHSCLHFFGLHLSSLIRAILVSLSDILKLLATRSCEVTLTQRVLCEMTVIEGLRASHLLYSRVEPQTVLSTVCRKNMGLHRLHGCLTVYHLII